MHSKNLLRIVKEEILRNKFVLWLYNRFVSQNAIKEGTQFSDFMLIKDSLKLVLKPSMILK